MVLQMTTLSFFVSGVPVAWQRARVATSAFGKMRFVNPTSLTAWQEQVAAAAVMAIRASNYRFSKAYTVTTTFHLPMPPSWSRKKQLTMIGKPHAQKPDIDNLLKAVLEIMSKPDGKRPRAWLMDDDAQITTITAEKRWCAPADAGVAVTVAVG